MYLLYCNFYFASIMDLAVYLYYSNEVFFLTLCFTDSIFSSVCVRDNFGLEESLGLVGFLSN